MSYGLMCLTCRKYIAPSDPKWGCACGFLCVPSVDGKTAATPEQIERERKAKTNDH